MTRLALIILCILSPLSAATAAPPNEQVSPRTALNEQLAHLHEGLPADACLEVTFRETRSFPFRRTDSILSGRLLRELGGEKRFVFNYEQPREMRVLYADGEVRLGRGERETTPSTEVAAGFLVFAALFEGNVDALLEDWSVSVEPDGKTFGLTPLTPHAAQLYARITLVFAESRLESITVRRPNGVEHQYEFGPRALLECEVIAAQFE